jgi:hypothetical protein
VRRFLFSARISTRSITTEIFINTATVTHHHQASDHPPPPATSAFPHASPSFLHFHQPIDTHDFRRPPHPFSLSLLSCLSISSASVGLFVRFGGDYCLQKACMHHLSRIIERGKFEKSVICDTPFCFCTYTCSRLLCHGLIFCCFSFVLFPFVVVVVYLSVERWWGGLGLKGGEM